VIYLDSSVALAHLLAEENAPPDSIWHEPLVSSRLLEYEVWNRIHAYDLARRHSQDAKRLLDGVTLLDMSEPVLARALRPFPVAVRALDALHLATIEYLRGAQDQIELASFDKRLLIAARALGISIYQT
jgi:hypothetical protein